MKKHTHKIIMMVMVLAITATSVNPLGVEAASKKKATINKKSATLTITVKKQAPAVTLKVKNAKVKKVKWTSSNKKVVAIKVTGKYSAKITAKKAGTTKITCKVNGKKLVCKITVKDQRKSSTENNNTDNSNKTVTPKCDHEWVEKWTVYEHEGDYGPEASACHCGVFDNFEELQQHLFTTMTCRAQLTTAKERETGIHSQTTWEKASVITERNSDGSTKHITIRSEYIEYFYCTKCNEKLGILWDGPEQD